MKKQHHTPFEKSIKQFLSERRRFSHDKLYKIIPTRDGIKHYIPLAIPWQDNYIKESKFIIHFYEQGEVVVRFKADANVMFIVEVVQGWDTIGDLWMPEHFLRNILKDEKVVRSIQLRQVANNAQCLLAWDECIWLFPTAKLQPLTPEETAGVQF